MAEGTFGTAINCMDGRTQECVSDYIKQNYGVDFVDAITEPGPIKIMVDRGELVGSIKQRLDISVNKHGSKIVAVVAHHDCAGNPAPKDEQMTHLKGALDLLKEWGLDAEVIGLWVGEDWKPERVL